MYTQRQKVGEQQPYITRCTLKLIPKAWRFALLFFQVLARWRGVCDVKRMRIGVCSRACLISCAHAFILTSMGIRPRCLHTWRARAYRTHSVLVLVRTRTCGEGVCACLGVCVRVQRMAPRRSTRRLLKTGGGSYAQGAGGARHKARRPVAPMFNVRARQTQADDHKHTRGCLPPPSILTPRMPHKRCTQPNCSWGTSAFEPTRRTRA